MFKTHWLIAVLTVFVGVQAHAQFTIPQLSAPVMDQAGLIDTAIEEDLNRILRELRDTGGSQINVLTVSQLDGMPIEQASIEVTDKWKLGSQKGDNGALFMIALAERKMRIEVGQGLEGSLPDAIAKRIIDEVVAPLMREGRTSEAVLMGVATMVKYTDPSFDFASRLQTRPIQRGVRSRERSSPWLWLIILFLFIFLRPRSRRSGLWGIPLGYGLGRSHGGWGGSFGGGGGWSGGGGGFSGGGASGGW